MNRIIQKWLQLKKINKKAFVVYITAGFPDISTTEKIVYALEKGGVDFIELGMPFSDPIADGPTIQYSSAVALDKGMSVQRYLQLIRRLRRRTRLPLIMMSYYNPIFKFGTKNFTKQATSAGLDGVIIPDLPPEEAQEFNRILNAQNISQIFLISPVTEQHRIKKITKISSGFVYYVSLTGVTGVRKRLASDLRRQIRKVKLLSRLPVFVGFGVSTPEQVSEITKVADGVIVGSVIIKIIQKNFGKRNLYTKISAFIKSMNKMTYKLEV